MRTNVRAADVAHDTTHEGTPARRLTAEQELRRTLLTCMLWEDAHYEKGSEIAERLAGLVLGVAPSVAAALAVEAREQAKLRHVPLYVARVMAGGPPAHRREVAALLERIIQRPDELTEFVALYWRDGRRPLSAQVKRGLARAFRKFDGPTLAKYNRDDGVRLRDVLFLTCPTPKDAAQAAAWKQLAEKTLPAPDTWEVALSAGADKQATWIRLLQERKLGALALLRNLRNMREVGVPLGLIREALETMRVDRVLPFRFIAAARHAPTLEPQIETAMFRCLEGTARLGGRTALVIDTSPSMWQARVSERSDMDRFDAAAALAILCREICDDVMVYAFNVQAYEVPARRGFALRDALAQTKDGASFGGLAVELANQRGYDRIIVLTDGQWHYSRTNMYQMREALTVSPAPLTAQAYMVNLAPYARGVGYGRWVSIDGWSEHVIRYIQAHERGHLG